MNRTHHSVKAAKVLSWGRDLDGYFGHQQSVITDVINALDAVLAAADGATLSTQKEHLTIAAGGAHTAALHHGQLYTWGIGQDGRLGHGDERYVYEPTLVDALKEESCVAVSAGYSHTAVVTDEGRLITWGRGDMGQLGHACASREMLPRHVAVLAQERVVAVVSGGLHTAAVTADGRLYTWGDNSQGQLGHSNGYRQELAPRLVQFTAGLAGQKVVVLAAGRYHTAVITEEGNLMKWGSDKQGGGLDGKGFEMERVPQVISSLNPQHIYTVAAGHMNPPAKEEEGGVVAGLRELPVSAAAASDSELEPWVVEGLVRRCLDV